MRIAKVLLADGELRVAVLEGDDVRLLDLSQVDNVLTLSDILHSPNPVGMAKFLIEPDAAPVDVDTVRLLAPVDHQEVWAAGVTYQRSQAARMEESDAGASHYDRVYTADRPELFYKANPGRVSGPGEPVRVRADSSWSVPEPELALVISPDMKLVGYTIGNDMSARDIEGENPLYLPQAKLYRQCAGLGPCILFSETPLDLPSTKIALRVDRNDETVYYGETHLDQMARSFDDLIGWLGKENDFPKGVILMTGTGIVPEDHFTLQDDDVVFIEVSGIGTLTNPVIKDNGKRRGTIFD